MSPVLFFEISLHDGSIPHFDRVRRCIRGKGFTAHIASSLSSRNKLIHVCAHAPSVIVWVCVCDHVRWIFGVNSHSRTTKTKVAFTKYQNNNGRAKESRLFFFIKVRSALSHL